MTYVINASNYRGPNLTSERAREVIERIGLDAQANRGSSNMVQAADTNVIDTCLDVAAKMTDLSHLRETTDPETLRTLILWLASYYPFAVVALQSELERVAPDRARKVAASIQQAWDHDDGLVYEHLRDWQVARDEGSPVGFIGD